MVKAGCFLKVLRVQQREKATPYFIKTELLAQDVPNVARDRKQHLFYRYGIASSRCTECDPFSRI